MDVLETLAQLFVTHGVPALHPIRQRSRSSRPFSVGAVVARGLGPRRDVVHRAGEPWANGSNVESFRDGKLRDELLDDRPRDRDVLHIDRSQDRDRTMAAGGQHGAAAQRAGLSSASASGRDLDTDQRVDHEPSSLIRTGTTSGGRVTGFHSLPRLSNLGKKVGVKKGESEERVGRAVAVAAEGFQRRALQRHSGWNVERRLSRAPRSRLSLW